MIGYHISKVPHTEIFHAHDVVSLLERESVVQIFMSAFFQGAANSLLGDTM